MTFEFLITVLIISLAIFVYFLIAFALINTWLMPTWRETIRLENRKSFQGKMLLRFCKFCCLIWPIGISFGIALGVLYLAFFDSGEDNE